MYMSRPMLALSLACSLGGCWSVARHERPEGDGDADTDADADTVTRQWCPIAGIEGHTSNRLDLLFVVDNSGSMAEEQMVLAAQIELVLQELINPAPPPDGEPPPAVDDLHVGIVSTDMGTGGYTIMTCSNPMVGDDGVLQNIGRYEGCPPEHNAADCDRASCPWLAHSESLPNDGTYPTNPPIWEDFGCIATLGTAGCGFEQHLEASLAALTEQTAPGMPNEGFLRGDSVLAVVYVTDEDDCSTGNAEMFNPSRDDMGPLNVRCAIQEQELFPIRRYHDGFLALRSGREDLVLVSAIAGVPIDGSWSPGDPVERLRELRQVNPSNPNEMLPSCETAMGVAFPPVRLVELIYAFGRNGTLESICRADWSMALGNITRAIQRRLTGTCLAADAPDMGAARCRLVERLVDDRPCPFPADVAGPVRTTGWHRDLGFDAMGRRLCEILPADMDGDGCPDGTCSCDGPDFSGCLQGWFINEDAAPCPAGRVQLTSPDVVSDLSSATFECELYDC